MGLEFDYKDGQTPLDDDEKESSPQKASHRTNLSQKLLSYYEKQTRT